MGFFSRLAVLPLWWLWTVLTRRKVLNALQYSLFLLLCAVGIIVPLGEPLYRLFDFYVVNTLDLRFKLYSLWLQVG